MPYANHIIGIYKITNTVTGHCYVGQSQRVVKRIREHFRLLRNGCHINPKLQRAFNKHGESAFQWSLEAVCQDVRDLDTIEEAFLSGKAWFSGPSCYNIAAFSKAPMRGKQHSMESKQKMASARTRNKAMYETAGYRSRLSAAQSARYLGDVAYRQKLKFIVDHPEMSYAARARAVGGDTSSVRRLAVKHAHLKGVL